MQGRYIFPLIGVAYIFIAKILAKMKNKVSFWISIGMTIALFFASGPIKFLLYQGSVFLD